MATTATLSIVAPEQIDIRLSLAGQGSRCAAFAIDALLRYGAAALLWLLARWAADFAVADLHGLAFAAVTLAFFSAQWIYFIAFETLGDGQTPGKRWMGLRVLDLEGSPPVFSAVALRNLLRIVDMLPVFYLLGHTVLFATPRRQRIGDLIARTVVVEDRREPSEWYPLSEPAGASEGHALAIEFLKRRDEIIRDPRDRLARQILATLERGHLEPNVDAEARLEFLVAGQRPGEPGER